jgi:hypothetical protein
MSWLTDNWVAVIAGVGAIIGGVVGFLDGWRKERRNRSDSRSVVVRDQSGDFVMSSPESPPADEPLSGTTREPVIVTLDAERQADKLVVGVSDLEQLISGARSAGATKTSIWVWLGPALLVFAGVVLTVGGTLVQPLIDEPDVDCVAYVQSLTELSAQYPDADIDGSALARTYGDDVVEQCGSPETYMAAIGR